MSTSPHQARVGSVAWSGSRSCPSGGNEDGCDHGSLPVSGRLSMATHRLLLATTVIDTADAFLAELAETLISAGWQVDLATSTENMDARTRPYQEIAHIPWTRGLMAPASAIAAVREIRRVIRRGRYELVHVHTPVAAALTRIAATSLRGRPRIIYTAHGFHFGDDSGTVARVAQVIEAALTRRTDAIITINEQDFRWASKYASAPCTVFRTHGVGVRKEFFSVARRPSHGRTLRVLSVGQLVSNKRHRLAMEAMAELGSGPCELVIIGAGPEHGALSAKAREIENATADLTIAIQPFTDDLASILASADILIHPSEREGLPTVVLEALAVGVPVVAFDIRGCRDLLAGGAGLLVSRSGDIHEMADAINTLRADDELRRTFSERGREVASGFGREECINETLAIYSHVLGRGLN